MGFFDKLFGPLSEKINDDWKMLTEMSQLEATIKHSMDKPVVIYKHSTRCGVSSMVLRQLRQEWNFDKDELEFYFLDLIACRQISNEIARRFGVVHESPQILLIRNGEAVYDASHNFISVDRLRRMLYTG